MFRVRRNDVPSEVGMLCPAVTTPANVTHGVCSEVVTAHVHGMPSEVAHARQAR